MGEIILACQGRASIIQSVLIKESQEGKSQEKGRSGSQSDVELWTKEFRQPLAAE